MSAELFRLAERELDDLLDIARPDLERRGVAIADGSAREANLWAFNFSNERELGEDRHRIATTLTVRDDLPPIMRLFATTDRVTFRNETQVPWGDLRRYGMAKVVEEALAEAQFKLQVRVGVDFAHEEFIRRCTMLLDLIGDDLPNAEGLRDRVRTWRQLAEQRALYSPLRRRLGNDLDFGHLHDDVRFLDEFYEQSIYAPLSARGPARAEAPAPPPPVEEDEPRELPRRVSLLDRLPKAPPVEPEASKPLVAVGVLLVLIALGLLAWAIVRHSWPWIAAAAVFLLLVIRALRRWHA
jgi:hypothetical protein